VSLIETLAPDTASYEPQPWQLEDITKMAKMPYSANWSEMGCFKTTTALWLMQEMGAKNALIITSKNGKGTYFDAFPKSLPGWKLFNVTLGKTTEVITQDFQIETSLKDLVEQIRLGWHNEPIALLIHYDCFSPTHSKKYGITETLSKVKWDFLACDEAHKLKNKDTGWTKEIKKLPAHHRHAMTGTGFVNNPAEIWSILQFLRALPHNLKGYWNFRTHFCEEYLDGNGFRHIMGLRKFRVSEFRKMRIDLGPRRLMTEVHKGIAEPIPRVIEVDLNPTQRRMYNEIKSVLQTLDAHGESLTSPTVLSQLTRLRQIAVATPKVVDKQFSQKQQRQVTNIKLTDPSAKLDAAMELIEEISWDDEVRRQVVVFSNFKDPLYLLENRLAKKDIPFLHMTVEMSESQRYKMWHDTFPKKEHKVFLSTLALGGESINLTPAQYLIFLDRSWSPKDMMQGIGRVYRPGQTAVPEIIYINARKTVDQYVEKKLTKKQGWFNDIFGS